MGTAFLSLLYVIGMLLSLKGTIGSAEHRHCEPRGGLVSEGMPLHSGIAMYDMFAVQSAPDVNSIQL
jgi:hypothetical protein